jgi:hypothetical protein
VDWETETCKAAVKHPASQFLECVRDCYLVQHVLEPTHHRGEQTANTLDLILSSEEDMISEVRVTAPIGKSHHGAVLAKVHLQLNVKEQRRTHYVYDKGDYEKMANHLESIDWESEMAGKNTQQSWDTFSKILLDVEKKCIPKRTTGSGSTRKQKPLWMNAQALAKVKKKQAAWRRYLETKDGQSYLEYCKYRNQARRATRQAMREFEKCITKEAKDNPKAFYNYVRSKSKSRAGINDLVTEDGTATADMDKAEVLNNFFASVFTVEDADTTPDFDPRLVESPINTVKFTVEEVKKKLKNLNPCKSPGPDRIHPRILKELASQLATPLQIIFQRSMDDGQLPNEWREAVIAPIFKKGAKDKPGNYRPVSLTSVVCKVMEGLVRDKIVSHMNDNNLFSRHQHGFISGRSCMTQLLEVMEQWTHIIDEKGCIDTVFFDFMKAFDSVPHRRLATKWKAYGIQGELSSWIEAFLKDRRQRVNVNNNLSAWKDVTSGVPQGSVIGPLLFVIYINDLPEMVHNTLKLFADDTKLYSQVETEEDCQQMQADIDALQLWSEKWLLKFHPQKCKLLRVGKGHPNFDYTMQDEAGPVTLPQVEHEKDIGVYVDKDLRFKEHINTTVSKANRLVGLIRRSFVYIDIPTFRNLFKVIVRPHLEYGNLIWSPRTKMDRDAIEGVQRRATKLVPGLKDKSYEDRLHVLNLPTLEYRRRRGDMLELYKYTHGLYQLDTPWMNLDPSPVTRGHNFKLKKLNCRTDLRKNVFSYRVVNAWNSLPNEVVNAPSPDCFKARLDRHWKDRQFILDP